MAEHSGRRSHRAPGLSPGLGLELQKRLRLPRSQKLHTRNRSGSLPSHSSATSAGARRPAFPHAPLPAGCRGACSPPGSPAHTAHIPPAILTALVLQPPLPHGIINSGEAGVRPLFRASSLGRNSGLLAARSSEYVSGSLFSLWVARLQFQ